MIEVAFGSSFVNTLKKKINRNKVFEEDFWNVIEIFINNPFDNRLKTHKLQGKLKELWSFSIDYDSRVIFYFEDNNKKAVLVDIGKHDEVY